MPKPKRPPARSKPKRANGNSPTPIDAQKQALREQEAKVAAKVQRLASFVEGAPELKKQREEERRIELIRQRSKGGRRLDVATLVDSRHPDMIGHSKRGRLKAEKRQERITFFGLLIALLLLTFWVWTFVR